MKFSAYVVMWVVLFAVPARSSAGQGSSPDAAAQADAAYQAKDWARAAALYSSLSKLPDAPPRVWIRLGNSQRSLGHNDEALAAFDKASQAGVPQFGEYGKATVYAATAQASKAFEALDRALAQGYADPDSLRADPNLNILHGDPRFAKLVELAQKNQRPCVYTTENRQFDFWIGEWTVTTTQGGVPAGDSKIELVLQDCVILENWKSGGNPYAGNS